MDKLTIKDVAEGISEKFSTPWRLNALFLSEVMDDGDTMRNIIHRCSGAAYNVMDALLDYYESHDKEKLIEDMDKIAADYPYIGFEKMCLEDENRDESQPTLREFEDMKRLASLSQENPDRFWSDWRLYEKASFLAKNYGDFFYCDKDGNYLVDDSVPITIYENKQPFTLTDNTGKESNWLDLTKYDEPHTLEVKDGFSVPFRQRKYVNATVIDILRKTAEGQEMANYTCPHNGDEALDKICSEIYDEEVLSAPKFVKALTLFNRRLMTTLKGGLSLHSGHFDTAAMLIDKAPEYFDKIDYVMQFGFHKTEAYKELLKFSFMTTFTKRQRFDEQAMNSYVNAAANAGHWMNAQNLVTKVILKNTYDFGGINRGILDLNLMRPRPTKFHGMENELIVAFVNQYYDRDLERQKYRDLYLAKQAVKPNKAPCADINRGPER